MSVPRAWRSPDSAFLTSGFPLALDRPFDRAAAHAAGVTDRHLRRLVEEGLLRRVLQGVYAAAQAPDSIADRARALRLVITPGAVVTGRTAGWLHGAPVLQRGAHLVAPPLEVCSVTDTRMTRRGVEGHRRRLRASDVTQVYDVSVTTPLRTACDLGRLLWRFDALAAIDAFLRLGVDREELLLETLRFPGYRGVRQLRALVPLGDRRSESPGESALRLHWLDAGLPPPDLQHEVFDDAGWLRFRLDVPDPQVRYAAEYDGVEFHSRPEDRAYDEERREWLRVHGNWSIDVFDKEDVYRSRTIVDRLQAGYRAALRTVRVWAP